MPKLSGKADVATAASGDLVVLLQDQGDGTFEIKNLTRDGAANIPFVKAQSSHGFSVGDVVRLDGSGDFTAATADTEANARVVGVVTEVIDTDSFAFKADGYVEGLSGLTTGSVHYLQDAGGLGTSAGTVEVPILLADSTTSGWLIPLGAGGGSGGGASQLDDLTDVDITSSGQFDHLQHDGSTFKNILPHTMKLVRNDTGSTISAGTLIEIHDANASTSRIRPADKDTSDSVDGIAAEEIGDNAEGVIKVAGTYDGVDTSGMTAGSALWLGDDGGFVDSAPTSGAVIRVAKVGIVHGSTGSIVLNLPAFETNLGDLSDVDAASPSDGQVLTWSNSNSAWEPTAASGVSNFVSLDDTPGSYSSGDAGKHLAVNNAEDAVEFVDPNVVSVNAQTGTSYTLVADDAGKVVELTNASAITLTVPPNSSVAFAVGTIIALEQGGGGTVTVSPGSGVTINSKDSNTDLNGQYASAALRKDATDTWVLTGDLA